MCYIGTDEEQFSIRDVANDQSSYPRARGWKLKHFTAQILEMVSFEQQMGTCGNALLAGEKRVQWLSVIVGLGVLYYW